MAADRLTIPIRAVNRPGRRRAGLTRPAAQKASAPSPYGFIRVVPEPSTRTFTTPGTDRFGTNCTQNCTHSRAYPPGRTSWPAGYRRSRHRLTGRTKASQYVRAKDGFGSLADPGKSDLSAATIRTRQFDELSAPDEF